MYFPRESGDPGWSKIPTCPMGRSARMIRRIMGANVRQTTNWLMTSAKDGKPPSAKIQENEIAILFRVLSYRWVET